MTIKESVKWIESLLQLDYKVVGVKFFFEKEEYDLFPAKENTHRMSYCTVVKRASGGQCQKVRQAHQACPGGEVALGFTEQSEGHISGRRRYFQKTYRNMGVSRKISKNMVYCQHKLYGISVMPLEEYNQEPDVVIIVCNPFNAMRISQGYAYNYGHIENIKFAGMQAICQECTSLPYENDQLNISMLCSGTRMLGKWGENDLAVGMPFRFLEDVIKGIKQTVNPLERNKNKEIIKNKLIENNLDRQLEISFNQNYDDNVYKGGKVD